MEEAEKIVYEFSTGAGTVRWLENHPGEIDLLVLPQKRFAIFYMSPAKRYKIFTQLQNVTSGAPKIARQIPRSPGCAMVDALQHGVGLVS